MKQRQMRAQTSKVSPYSRQFINPFELVRKNMRTMLAEKLKDATFELRKVEKDHYMKV